eukprot:TRINITY_DN67828_c4_g6_i2.p1 TRINITY_DN67828_c4_g6~~TRINITY_DN67828_c4_g6_i2.p1  ORF type:complete len:249 (-),score=29.10 TRINITY_DN67828_c4_g6_i2:159-905(-)
MAALKKSIDKSRMAKHGSAIVAAANFASIRPACEVSVIVIEGARPLDYHSKGAMSILDKYSDHLNGEYEPNPPPFNTCKSDALRHDLTTLFDEVTPCDTATSKVLAVVFDEDDTAYEYHSPGSDPVEILHQYYSLIDSSKLDRPKPVKTAPTGPAHMFELFNHFSSSFQVQEEMKSQQDEKLKALQLELEVTQRAMEEVQKLNWELQAKVEALEEENASLKEKGNKSAEEQQEGTTAKDDLYDFGTVH